MSIEVELSRIATALETLIGKMAAPTVAAPIPTPVASVAPTPAPVVPVSVAPVPTPVQVPPPVQTSPIPSDAPIWNSPAEMAGWLTTQYQRLGKDKGAAIQVIMQNLGCAHISAIKPEHYALLKAQVEAL